MKKDLLKHDLLLPVQVKKLQKGRKNVIIGIQIPEDVIEDLKRVAPLLGFSGYQPLMRAYIGQGLQADLEKLE